MGESQAVMGAMGMEGCSCFYVAPVTMATRCIVPFCVARVVVPGTLPRMLQDGEDNPASRRRGLTYVCVLVSMCAGTSCPDTLV